MATGVASAPSGFTSAMSFLGDGVNDAPALPAADVGVAVDGGTCGEEGCGRGRASAESACSGIVVTFAIRPHLRWYRSSPSASLLAASIGAGALALLLPYTSDSCISDLRRFHLAPSRWW